MTQFEGQYLTYAEYQELGGSAIGQMPFNLLEFEARKTIDLRTQNRLKDETEIPFEVKVCDFHLINTINSYLQTLAKSNGLVSFNSDGYSESYASPTEIKEIVNSRQAEFEYILRTDLTGVIVNDELLLFDGVKKMKCNGSLTVYHKSFDKNMIEIWTRFNYANVWFYGGQGAGIDKGYENANDVEIRIPYGQNANLDFGNFSIGDIVVNGTLETNITTQQDLNGYEFYNITSKRNNTYGQAPHIHLGGK